MGRTVLADEGLVTRLTELSNKPGCQPGLILGQFSEKKDFVVLLPTTLLPEPKMDKTHVKAEPAAESSINKVIDIEDSLMCEHARTVTRMLPGGLWVLGFYMVTPEDVFTDKNALNKLRSIANAIHNSTRGNEFMNGKDPSKQKLILHFSSKSKRYVCKSLEMDNLNSSLFPVDWKFKSNPTSWQQVNALINFDWLPPFYISNNTASPKKKLLECLASFRDHLDKLTFIINGAICTQDEPLLKLVKQKRVQCIGDDGKGEDEGEEGQYKLVFLEVTEGPEVDIDGEEIVDNKEARIVDTRFEMNFTGMLASRAFLNDKATADDACTAVKIDMLRSLASRLEMHWETFDNAENKTSGAVLFRLPPRRILFRPDDFDVSFSEYVFEGESDEDIYSSINENLGFTESEGKISELECKWAIPMTEAVDVVDGGDKSQSKLKDPFSKNRAIIGVILAAIITVVISFIFQYYITS